MVHATLLEAVAAHASASAAAAAAAGRLVTADYPVLLEGPGGQRRTASQPELLQTMTAAAQRLLDPTTADGRLIAQLGLVA